MFAIESVEAIQDKVVAMVARHAGVPVEAVRGNTRIWKKFPPSHREHPSVTAFVKDVRAEFGVYLTEEEWENPTLKTLSERIRAKRENPALSVADWERDQTALRGGVAWMVGIGAVMGLVAFAVAPGSLTYRVLLAGGLCALMSAIGLIGVYLETRRLGARPHKD
jgi:hypothetical protein